MPTFHEPTSNHYDCCLAVNRRTGVACAGVRESVDSLWCDVHEQYQGKLYKNYKLCNEALDAARLLMTLPTEGQVKKESRLRVLRKWNEQVRARMSLTWKVVWAREDHRYEFYFDITDEGHLAYIKSLRAECEELEDLLYQLDERAYNMILMHSGAEWILHLPPVIICVDQSSSQAPPINPAALPSSPRHSATLPSPSASSAKRRKRKTLKKLTEPASQQKNKDIWFAPPKDSTASLLASLLDYLIPPPDLPPSIRPETWRKFISGLFRQVIVRTNALFSLIFGDEKCAGFDNVESFLHHLGATPNSDQLVKKLWCGLKLDEKGGHLDGNILAQELYNLDRLPLDDEVLNEGLDLLGGRVWRMAARGHSLSDECWDIYHQFITCSSCAFKGARSNVGALRQRHITALGIHPGWSSKSGGLNQIWEILGGAVSLGNKEECGKKLRRVAQGVGKQKKVVVEEVWTRAMLFCVMSANSSRTLEFLDYLTTEELRKEFLVCSRRNDTEQVTHHPSESAITKPCGCGHPNCTDQLAKLWCKRSRMGALAERENAEWEVVQSIPADTALDCFVIGPSDGAMPTPEEAARAKAKRPPIPFDDAVQEILIMDERPYQDQSTWESFAALVKDAICKFLGGGTVEEVMIRERERLGRQPQTVSVKAQKMFKEFRLTSML